MKYSVIVLLVCAAQIWAVPVEEQVQAKSIQAHPGGRIIGGDLAKDKQFPWQVAVYFDTPDGSFFCGGALISPLWIVTAGHCVKGATIFTLHLGSNSLVDDDPNRITVATTKSVAHPDYSSDTLENDIGLIELQTPVEINDYIQPIKLPSAPVADGASVVVSGWGATGSWDGVVNDLNFVGLNTISNADCRKIYGDVVKDTMVCAQGPGNEGTCSGDSGGPLVEGNSTVLVGVVSFASASGCDTSDPSGYTRVESYLDWINSQIN